MFEINGHILVYSPGAGIKTKGLLVLKKKIFKDKIFTIYGRGDHLSHVTWTIYLNLHCPVPLRLHMKLGFV